MTSLTNEEIRQKIVDELDARFYRSPSHQDHVLIRLKKSLKVRHIGTIPKGSIGVGKFSESSILKSDLSVVDGYDVTFIHDDGNSTSTQAHVDEVEVLCGPAASPKTPQAPMGTPRPA
ncbi:hypothetical protein OIU34_17040 [Pararhizobium sp. BT-229]|uniref:hypothetical protein n=1 Tax=Pararhizobium sp. BT-229 TaxID=2986923 RepID=UPI0021F6B0B5|nr:hypothetical protein [Pararhizobium sp. BT-229]MCV9963607.1 hypothetical protein [Pararhizobium sp. BT-229]